MATKITNIGFRISVRIGGEEKTTVREAMHSIRAVSPGEAGHGMPAGVLIADSVFVPWENVPYVVLEPVEDAHQPSGNAPTRAGKRQEVGA